MREPRDIVDIAGLKSAEQARAAGTAGEPMPGARNWLGVWFKCCHVYGRMYKNEFGTRYTGYCPRCGAEVGARVGTGGTSRRFFEAS